MFTEEDTDSSYGKLLLRYYVAEGVINKHEIFFASADCKPESILQVCETIMLCIGMFLANIVHMSVIFFFHLEPILSSKQVLTFSMICLSIICMVYFSSFLRVIDLCVLWQSVIHVLNLCGP